MWGFQITIILITFELISSAPSQSQERKNDCENASEGGGRNDVAIIVLGQDSNTHTKFCKNSASIPKWLSGNFPCLLGSALNHGTVSDEQPKEKLSSGGGFKLQKVPVTQNIITIIQQKEGCSDHGGLPTSPCKSQLLFKLLSTILNNSPQSDVPCSNTKGELISQICSSGEIQGGKPCEENQNSENTEHEPSGRENMGVPQQVTGSCEDVLVEGGEKEYSGESCENNSVEKLTSESSTLEKPDDLLTPEKGSTETLIHGKPQVAIADLGVEKEPETAVEKTCEDCSTEKSTNQNKDSKLSELPHTDGATELDMDMKHNSVSYATMLANLIDLIRESAPDAKTRNDSRDEEPETGKSKPMIKVTTESSPTESDETCKSCSEPSQFLNSPISSYPPDFHPKEVTETELLTNVTEYLIKLKNIIKLIQKSSPQNKPKDENLSSAPTIQDKPKEVEVNPSCETSDESQKGCADDEERIVSHPEYKPAPLLTDQNSEEWGFKCNPSTDGSCNDEKSDEETHQDSQKCGHDPNTNLSNKDACSSQEFDVDAGQASIENSKKDHPIVEYPEGWENDAPDTVDATQHKVNPAKKLVVTKETPAVSMRPATDTSITVSTLKIIGVLFRYVMEILTKLYYYFFNSRGSEPILDTSESLLSPQVPEIEHINNDALEFIPNKLGKHTPKVQYDKVREPENQYKVSNTTHPSKLKRPIPKIQSNKGRQPENQYNMPDHSIKEEQSHTSVPSYVVFPDENSWAAYQIISKIIENEGEVTMERYPKLCAYLRLLLSKKNDIKDCDFSKEVIDSKTIPSSFAQEQKRPISPKVTGKKKAYLTTVSPPTASLGASIQNSSEEDDSSEANVQASQTFAMGGETPSRPGHAAAAAISEFSAKSGDNSSEEEEDIQDDEEEEDEEDETNGNVSNVQVRQTYSSNPEESSKPQQGTASASASATSDGETEE